MVKVAIIHEGNSNKTHDNKLIKLLLENLKLDENKVQFFGIGTKSNFFKTEHETYKELSLHIKNETVGKVLFIVDADYNDNDKVYGGFKNTNDEIKKIQKELSIESISDIYVTCDPNTKEGYLESLILSSIPVEQKDCIEKFLKCNDFKSKENHKAILNQIYNIAYPKAPYDFSHSNFDELKQKLQNLY